MARLNGKRRRALALLRARQEFAKVLNPTTQAETGQVRSSHKVHIAAQVVPAVARAYSPKPLNWETKGQRVKRPPGKPPVQTFTLTPSQLERAQFAGGAKRSLGAQSLPTDTGDGED
jgi:hypothetical protein